MIASKATIEIDYFFDRPYLLPIIQILGFIWLVSKMNISLSELMLSKACKLL